MTLFLPPINPSCYTDHDKFWWSVSYKWPEVYNNQAVPQKLGPNQKPSPPKLVDLASKYRAEAEKTYSQFIK